MTPCYPQPLIAGTEVDASSMVLSIQPRIALKCGWEDPCYAWRPTTPSCAYSGLSKCLCCGSSSKGVRHPPDMGALVSATCETKRNRFRDTHNLTDLLKEWLCWRDSKPRQGWTEDHILPIQLCKPLAFLFKLYLPIRTLESKLCGHCWIFLTFPSVVTLNKSSFSAFTIKNKNKNNP